MSGYGMKKRADRMPGLFEENLKQVMEKDPDHKNYYITVRFGQYVYKAYVDWAQLLLLGVPGRRAAGCLCRHCAKTG